MKKVLFVIRALSGDGAERALSNIIMSLPENYEIELLLNDGSLAVFPYKGTLRTLGIPQCQGIRKNLHALFYRTKVLRRLKKENHYDAVISFLDSANISNVLSGNRHCKTIVSVRVSMISKQSKLLYRAGALFLMNFVYNRADKIVAVSKEIEEELKRAFHLKDSLITSVVNGYQVGNIIEQSKQMPMELSESPEVPWKTKGDAKWVITVGRLNKQKGQWHLIRAFSEVVKHEPAAKLLIIGKGELHDSLQKLIRVYGLEDSVFLTGYCSNPYWFDAQADVFVLPSMYEGYPNVLAEAICCGVPCVAADFHSGARELLAPGMDVFGPRVEKAMEVEYGILTPLCSGKQYKDTTQLEEAEHQMADAILSVLQDEALRNRCMEKAKKRRDDLHIDRVIGEWEKLI
jgi:glycosyltransferase involved in cell wall biosynthesis